MKNLLTPKQTAELLSTSEQELKNLRWKASGPRYYFIKGQVWYDPQSVRGYNARKPRAEYQELEQRATAHLAKCKADRMAGRPRDPLGRNP